MARKPEDQACDDCLVEHEAERQDSRARSLKKADPAFVENATRVVLVVAKAKVSAKSKKAAIERAVRGVLLAAGASGNAWADLTRKQLAREDRIFGGRSGSALRIEPITRKRIKARQEQIEAERKVEGPDGAK